MPWSKPFTYITLLSPANQLCKVFTIITSILQMQKQTQNGLVTCPRYFPKFPQDKNHLEYLLKVPIARPHAVSVDSEPPAGSPEV